nr:hypothetical protein [Pseudoalteromonas sp. H100]
MTQTLALDKKHVDEAQVDLLPAILTIVIKQSNVFYALATLWV